jgi:hypothetical protein
MKNIKYSPSIEELEQKYEMSRPLPRKKQPLAVSIEEAV